ncbi:MAG: hypothetical protein FJX74_03990 [Armatimonadetes bacterium]|nr:hypothetical protein [Armatimonadota bacterium]
MLEGSSPVGGLLAMIVKSSPVGQGLSLLIMALLLVGLVWVARSAIGLRGESRRLERDMAGPPLAPVFECALLREHARIIRQWGANVQAAIAAVQGLTNSQLSVANAFPRWLGRIFLMLGLLGTVWGLGGSIAALSPDQATQPEASESGALDLREAGELSKRLLASFQHMETVFLCTMAGIVAAIVMTGANAWLAWRQERFASEAERFAVEVVAPAVLAQTVVEIEATPAGWIEASRRMGEVFGTLRQAVESVNQTAGQIQTTLGSGATELTASATALGKVTTQLGSATDAIRGATGQLTTALVDVTAQQQRNAELLARVEGSLKATDERLAHAGDALERRLNHAAREMSESLMQARGGVEELVSGVKASTDAAATAASAIAEQLQLTRTMLDTLRQTAETQFSGVLTDSQARLAGALGELVDAHRAALEETQRVSSEHLKELTREQADVQGVVRLAQQELTEEIVAQVARLGEIGAEAVQTVPRRLGEIEAGQERLQRAIEALGPRPAPARSWSPFGAARGPASPDRADRAGEPEAARQRRPEFGAAPGPMDDASAMGAARPAPPPVSYDEGLPEPFPSRSPASTPSGPRPNEQPPRWPSSPAPPSRQPRSSGEAPEAQPWWKRLLPRRDRKDARPRRGGFDR